MDEGRDVAGEFVVVVEAPLAPAQAWARVWDVDRHTEVIPLTRVSTQPPATALSVGVRFCGRTALGPVGFDDPMKVLVWEPPSTVAGHAVVAKTGRVIGGRIEVTFVPTDEGATRITWYQAVEIPWLPPPLSGLEQVVGRLVAPGYRAVLRRLLA